MVCTYNKDITFVTAAHCVTIPSEIVPPSVKPQDLMVVLGKHLRDWDQNQSSEIRVEVSSRSFTVKWNYSNIYYLFVVIMNVIGFIGERRARFSARQSNI